MSYTGRVLWTVWELDVEDYEILLYHVIMYAESLYSQHKTDKTIYLYYSLFVRTNESRY